MSKLRGASRTSITAVACFALAQVSHAQSGGDDDLSEIVVTAQGREQALQNVPISVTVVDGVRLQEQNIGNLEQLAQRVPSLKIQSAPQSDVLNIRGVGSSVNLGFEQSVGTFVDGIYRGRSRSQRAALFDIDRVEVLKGPQTTFFGNNAIAGALNISTKRPSSEFGGEAALFYAAEADEYSVQAAVDLPLSPTLAIRAAGKWSGMNGYIKNSGTGFDGPHLDDQVGRLSMLWEPSPNISMTARLDAGKLRDRGTFNSELINCPPEAPIFVPAGACARYLAGSPEDVDNRLDYRSNSGPSYSNLDYLEFAQTTRIQAGASEIILTTGYYDHHHDNLTDAAPIPQQFASVVDPLKIRRAAAAVRFNENFDQFSQEIRVQSSEPGPISYMAGAYYHRSDLRIQGNLSLYYIRAASFAPDIYPDPATPLAAAIYNRERAETLSGFAAFTFHASDRLRLNLSGRYSRVKKRASRLVQLGTDGDLPGASFVPSAAATTALAPLIGIPTDQYAVPSRTDDRFIPAAGIEYDVSDHILLYATYAKGFKAGGFAATLSNSVFGPETVDSFEAGLKSTFFDRLITVNLAIFHMKYKGLQESLVTLLDSGVIVNDIANVAASTSKGIDASLSIKPLPSLTFYADAELLDSRYDSYRSAPCTIRQAATFPRPCTQDLSGSRRAFSPRFSGSFGVDYSQDLSAQLRFSANLSAYVTSAFYVNPTIDEYLRQPGYTRIDARLGIASPAAGWDLALVGRNLTNRYIGGFRQSVATSPGSIQVLPEAPRSIGLQASIKF